MMSSFSQEQKGRNVQTTATVDSSSVTLSKPTISIIAPSSVAATITTTTAANKFQKLISPLHGQSPNKKHRTGTLTLLAPFSSHSGAGVGGGNSSEIEREFNRLQQLDIGDLDPEMDAIGPNGLVQLTKRLGFHPDEQGSSSSNHQTIHSVRGKDGPSGSLLCLTSAQQEVANALPQLPLFCCFPMFVLAWKIPTAQGSCISRHGWTLRMGWSRIDSLSRLRKLVLQWTDEVTAHMSHHQGHSSSHDLHNSNPAENQSHNQLQSNHNQKVNNSSIDIGGTQNTEHRQQTDKMQQSELDFATMYDRCYDFVRCSNEALLPMEKAYQVWSILFEYRQGIGVGRGQNQSSRSHPISPTSVTQSSENPHHRAGTTQHRHTTSHGTHNEYSPHNFRRPFWPLLKEFIAIHLRAQFNQTVQLSPSKINVTSYPTSHTSYTNQHNFTLPLDERLVAGSCFPEHTGAVMGEIGNDRSRLSYGGIPGNNTKESYAAVTQTMPPRGVSRSRKLHKYQACSSGHYAQFFSVVPREVSRDLWRDILLFLDVCRNIEDYRGTQDHHHLHRLDFSKYNRSKKKKKDHRLTFSGMFRDDKKTNDGLEREQRLSRSNLNDSHSKRRSQVTVTEPADETQRRGSPFNSSTDDECHNSSDGDDTGSFSSDSDSDSDGVDDSRRRPFVNHSNTSASLLTGVGSYGTPYSWPTFIDDFIDWCVQDRGM